MKAIVIKCPNCGAKVEGAERVARCSYCQAEVRIQRRTGFFERVEPAPANLPPEIRRLPVVVQGRSARWVGVVAVIPFFAVVFAVGFGFYMDNRSKRPVWDGGYPAVVDIDGSLEVIGFVRKKAKTRLVTAVNAKTGKRRWTTHIGNRSEQIGSVLAVVGDAVLIGDKGGNVHGLDLESGKKRFKVRLSEKVERFCSAAEGAVAELADKKRLAISLTDGTTSEHRPACDPVPNNDDEDQPSFRVHSTSEAHNIRSAVKGVAPGDLVSAKNGHTFLLGYKTPGTSTPFVSAVVPPPNMDFGMATELWRQVVPGIDPLKAATGAVDTEEFGTDGKDIALAYNLSGGGHKYRLTLMAGETGKRAWDVRLPHDMPLDGIAIAGDVVLASRWGSLTALDRKTGKVRWTID